MALPRGVLRRPAFIIKGMRHYGPLGASLDRRPVGIARTSLRSFGKRMARQGAGGYFAGMLVARAAGHRAHLVPMGGANAGRGVRGGRRGVGRAEDWSPSRPKNTAPRWGLGYRRGRVSAPACAAPKGCRGTEGRVSALLVSWATGRRAKRGPGFGPSHLKGHAAKGVGRGGGGQVGWPQGR